MKTLRIVCNFLLSLVQALFPRGLKGRHSCPGDPVAGADSTVVASSEGILQKVMSNKHPF